MQQLCEKGVSKYCRNNSADTKVTKQGGRGGAPGVRADSPAVPGANHVDAAVPLQPMEDQSGAQIQWQPMKNLTPEQVNVP